MEIKKIETDIKFLWLLVTSHCPLKNKKEIKIKAMSNFSAIGVSDGDSMEEIEMTEHNANRDRQSMRVDASSVKHVMEAFLRTATIDRKLDMDPDASEDRSENHVGKDNEDFRTEDSESKRTRHSSLASRIRIERLLIH